MIRMITLVIDSTLRKHFLPGLWASNNLDLVGDVSITIITVSDPATVIAEQK